ncbi:hypothetical protein ABZP36_016963 [Zizania latifolia]
MYRPSGSQALLWFTRDEPVCSLCVLSTTTGMEQDNPEAKKEAGDEGHIAKKSQKAGSKHSGTIKKLNEMFSEERGYLQYKIPEREKLVETYKQHYTVRGQRKRWELIKIGDEVVIRGDSFTLGGKATMDNIMFLFGAPVSAVAARRIVPGLGWLSDDVVLPLATSGAVAYISRQDEAKNSSEWEKKKQL